MSESWDQPSLESPSYAGRTFVSKRFHHIDLSGTDFRQADLRGVQFISVNLQNANFEGVRAGHSELMRLILLACAIVLGILASVILGTTGLLSAGLFQLYFLENYHILPGLVVLVAIAVFVGMTGWQGYLRGLFWMVISLIAQAVLIGLPTKSLPGVGASALIMALALVGTTAAAFSSGLILALTQQRWRIALGLGGCCFAIVTGYIESCTQVIQQLLRVYGNDYPKVAEQLMNIAGAKNIAIALSSVGTINHTPYGVSFAVTVALGISLILMSLGLYAAWASLAEHPEFEFTRRWMIQLAALGGTNFHDSDLTGASFQGAALRHANFSHANLTRVNWFASHDLNRVYWGESYLQTPLIQRLVQTKSAQRQIFDHLLLSGINLSGAKLVFCSFIETDLSQADLSYTDLSGASLVRTQLSQADLSHACLTGACIADWIISSDTVLDEVVCDYVFTRNPAPDELDQDKGRKPDNRSEVFAPGDFADFIHPLQQTLDLFHHQSFNVREAAIALNQLIDNHPEAGLEVKAIERRGEDGKSLLIRLATFPEADKSELKHEYDLNYERLKRLSNQHLYQLLAQQDRHIQMLLDQLRTVSNHQLESQHVDLAFSPAQLAKRVTLTLGEGTFRQGFNITLSIGLEGMLQSRQVSGQLPPNTEIAEAYRRWQASYRMLDQVFRIKAKPTQLKQVSVQYHDSPAQLAAPFLATCQKAARAVVTELNAWLNSEPFREVERALREELLPTDEVHFVIQGQDPELRRLPWQTWQWFERYHQSDVAFGSLTSKRINRSIPYKAQIRILLVIGSSDDLQIETDRQIIERLPNAEVYILREPSRLQLDEILFDRQGWDILCFAGHSASEPDGQQGWLYLNEHESLSVEQIRHALTTAITSGLKMVILNSCDGLGLAKQLASLDLPQMIVMREPVPDRVAHAFLAAFLPAFASGQSIYIALSLARKQLQRLEVEYPCAGWMPVLCQNPSEVAWGWDEMKGINQLYFAQAVEQFKGELLNHPNLDAAEQAEILYYLEALFIARRDLATPEGESLQQSSLLYLNGAIAQWLSDPNTVKLSRSLTQLLTAIQQPLQLR